MADIKTPKDVVELIKKEEVSVVDLRFMDFPGLWQHFSVPSRELTVDSFEKGFGFDGSSIRGWQAINESDMIVKHYFYPALVPKAWVNSQPLNRVING